ncbi:MAG: hypothetical protein JO042_07125 [Sinobacteraceae bacterium]|nr:hypothetical protein [Nevskiaceae bacterium]
MWQLIDADGVWRGQAAMFPSWQDVRTAPSTLLPTL